MILGFKKNFNGKPTFFVEKILAHIGFPSFKRKIHTLRKGNRWKAGQKIHMATGVRTKKYYRFNWDGSGLDVCKAVQTVNIEVIKSLNFLNCFQTVYVINAKDKELGFRVTIDGRPLTGSEVDTLAVNDGFNNALELFTWLNFESWEGQLIHWTDKKY